MGSSSNKNLVLAAMVFAVAMTFIDQTIVAIAIPIQRELGLSPTGAQWVINGYLLSLAALFAFGGRLGDVLGRRRMVVIGVTGFAIVSACCGFTTKGGIAETWIIGFRVIQGATAALLFPAAVGIVWFFLGFVVMAQVGGRILDRHGAKLAVVSGSALSAVGFYLLAGRLTHLALSSQSLYIALAGGGLGLMLGTASKDAVNRAPSANYSEVTGITQTARNFGGSLGLAVLGAILISRNDTNITLALTKHGVPPSVAHRVAASIGFSPPGSASGHGQPHAIVHAVQIAATFVIAVRGLARGRLAPHEEPATGLVPADGR
ncbi:MAG TPA: MFS transporter [Solirubrobacteraceae bacterium]